VKSAEILCATLCVLCVSAVSNFINPIFTAETQRAPRPCRENLNHDSNEVLTPCDALTKMRTPGNVSTAEKIFHELSKPTESVQLNPQPLATRRNHA